MKQTNRKFSNFIYCKFYIEANEKLLSSFEVSEINIMERYQFRLSDFENML